MKNRMLPLEDKREQITGDIGSIGKVLTRRLLSGEISTPEKILELTRLVTSAEPSWVPPYEYLVPDVSSMVLRIVTGYLHS